MSHFANFPFANVLCHSATKRNEHCARICFVLSVMIQKSDTRVYTSFFEPLIRRKQLRNWPNTYEKWLQKLANRTLAKRLVGETAAAPMNNWNICLNFQMSVAGPDKVSSLHCNVSSLTEKAQNERKRQRQSFHTVKSHYGVCIE